MASREAFLQLVLEQLSGLEEITYRPMMGEYLLYYRGKLVGGLYDDRLLVKPVPAAVARLPEGTYEAPYPGAKPMLLVEQPFDRPFLEDLLRGMYRDLPDPKPKQTKCRKNGNNSVVNDSSM